MAQNKAAIQLGIQIAQLGKSDLSGALALAEQGVRDFPGPVLPQGRTFGWLRDTIAASIAKSAPKVAEQPVAAVQPSTSAPVAQPQRAPLADRIMVGHIGPKAEPVQAQAEPAPVAVPLPEVAKPTLRIVHAVEEGTRLLGTQKGDGVNKVMGKDGQKWRFYMAGKFWYVWGSRGGKADRARINRAAVALRAGGWTVEVEIDDVDPATGQVAAPKVSQAEQVRRMRAYNHAESGLLWVLTNQGGVKCGKGCGADDLALRTSKVLRNEETNLPMAICLPCAGVKPEPVAEVVAVELPEIIAPEPTLAVEAEPVVSTAELAAELREFTQELEPYRAKPVRRTEVVRMSVAELRELAVVNFGKAWDELVRRLEVAEARAESAPVAQPVAAGDDCGCGNGKVGVPHEAMPGRACRIRAARVAEQPAAQPVAEPVTEQQAAPEQEQEQPSDALLEAVATADATFTFEIEGSARPTIKEVRSKLHNQVTVPVNKLIDDEDKQMRVKVFHHRKSDKFTVTVWLSPIVDAATTLERVERIATGIKGVGARAEDFALAG
ncbi:hypothetical protein [Micromonospora sp. RV43]|uniref:hypothetical protein n=1 Tax=Micromonospora sp. RV43 TaxID=1661387 RepID=UPI00064BDF38|nr:hypothetical protein [Micromonospora sp. RV43]